MRYRSRFGIDVEHSHPQKGFGRVAFGVRFFGSGIDGQRHLDGFELVGREMSGSDVAEKFIGARFHLIGTGALSGKVNVERGQSCRRSIGRSVVAAAHPDGVGGAGFFAQLLEIAVFQ